MTIKPLSSLVSSLWSSAVCEKKYSRQTQNTGYNMGVRFTMVNLAPQPQI